MGLYTHHIVKPQPHPPVVRTAAGNTEERVTQIQRIKERLDRLGGNAQHVATELVVLAREIRTLTAPEDLPDPALRERKQTTSL